MRTIFWMCVSLVIGASVAQAAPANDKHQALAGLYVGEFSALRDPKHESFMGGAEYRYKDIFYGVRPTVGAFGTGDGELYGYAGINWDLPLGIAPVYITPGFGAGYYHDNGAKRLGYALQFRSTLEATYQFESHERIGLAISHLSNASLGNKNPGTETLQAVFVLPLN